MKQRKVLLGCALSLSLITALASAPSTVMAQGDAYAAECTVEEDIKVELEESVYVAEAGEEGEEAEAETGTETESVAEESVEDTAEEETTGETEVEESKGENETESESEAETEEESEKRMLDVIYVGGEAASDENTGAAAETPVATLAEALNWVNEGGTIVLTGDVDGSEITKSITLQSEGGVITSSSVYVSSAYIVVTNGVFANGVVFSGNGSNSVTFSGAMDGNYNSISGFATITVDASVLRTSNPNSPDIFLSCSNLNLNGGSVISGAFSTGSLCCSGQNQIINLGNIFMDSLSVDGELIVTISGKFGDNMEAGITVLTVANGISADTLANITLNSLNSRNGLFILKLDGNSLVTVAHEHILVLVDEVKPTCTEDGVAAYYTCSDCGAMYNDANGEYPIGMIYPIEKLGHEWADTLSYDETGHWYGCNHSCAEKMSFEEHVLNEKGVCKCGYEVFEVLEGKAETYTVGSEEGLRFRFAGSVEDFKALYVDGNLVDPADYKVESGSVIITLSKDFLKKLSVGDHTLTVEHTYGKTEVGFKVAEVKPGTGESENKGETGKKEESKKLDTAKTGDTVNLIMLLSMTVFFGLTALVAGVEFLRKRR